MADRFADNFFGSYLMGGRPEFGMSPFAPIHPAQSPAEDIGTKAALLRGVLPFAPGGGIMELPETQRQYQTAKQQIGEGNYGQAIVPGLYAGLGGLDATADAAMAAAGIWPPVLAGALGAKFLAKSGKAVLKAADLDPSGFYSSTRRAIEGLQDTGTGNQFAGQLGGVAKVKEMEDSGVAALLASRGDNRVTKNELLEQHDRGRPQFEEKWKRTPGPQRDPEEFGWAIQEAEARGDWAEVERLNREWEVAAGYGPANAPRWGEQVIPGGENYQELLLTLPSPKLPKRMATQAERNRGYAFDDPDHVNRVDADGMVSDTSRTEFRGGHDPEPDVLIRVRTTDRIDADGKRTLFVEEFQSDWHQAGRDRGYRTGPQFSGELSAKEMPDGIGWEIRDENNVFVTNVLIGSKDDGGRVVAHADDALAAARRRIDDPSIGEIATDYRVPDAPLKGVWPETALRRMIRHASENGYDSISWTTGRMQQDRYNLSKHIDNIEVRQLSPKQAKDNNFSLEETRVVQINGKDGGPVYTSAVDKDGILLSGGPHQNKHLSEVVGNEVSQKIMATHQKKFEGLSMADEARLDNLSTKRIAESLDGLTPAERNEYLRLIKKREDASYRTLVKLEDLDLRVGGEWAENLYDKQLVNAANKWAKKRGGKVRKGTIDAGLDPAEDATRSMETWTLDITPEMKTGALLEGMPMYGLGAGILGAAAARGIGETEREAY